MEGLWKPKTTVVEHADIKVEIELKCIASEDNPYGWTEIDEAWDTVQEDLRIKIRQRLLAEFENDTDAVIADVLPEEHFKGDKRTMKAAVLFALYTDTEYKAAHRKRCKQLVELGTTGGAATIGSLFKAGGPRGGPLLIEKAATAVVNFHEVSPSQGEA